jgi:hypothetical protein
VAGEIHTAAHHNTYERDNIAWMATDSPCCRVYHNAAQSITTGTDTVLSFNSERFDNAAMHSTSSNTSRITIPTGGDGKILFGAVVEYASGNTGGRGCYVKLNGTTYIAKMVLGANPDGGSSSVTNTSSYAMSAADYLQIYAYQSQGSSLNVQSSSAYSPEAWAFWFRT